MSESRLLIHGGTVIDGTGAPGFRSDVRVRDGRITEVGPDLAPEGETEIDATGALVTPGFIDSHAHTDPQVFWDPTLDPEPLHGVTTMLVGNCSLSLFPVTEASRARYRICSPTSKTCPATCSTTASLGHGRTTTATATR